MPQFDIANFAPQLAWLALFFAILFFGVVRLTLPKLGRVVDERAATVTGDIDAADRAKSQADGIRTAHEAAMADARSKAQASVADAKAAANRATEARLATVSGELDTELATATNAIENQRRSALGEIAGVAEEAAADIIERLTGNKPDEAAVKAAVAQSLKTVEG